MHLIPVIRPEDARQWEADAVASGRTLATLMSNAGRAATQLIVDNWGYLADDGVLVACGSGNNGGDGWVVAQALQALGVPVWVTEVAPPTSVTAAAAREVALHDGVRLVGHDGPWPNVGLVVDALLGSGAVGAPRPPMKELLARIRDLHRPVVALDGPTGLDLSTGAHHGEVHAVATVAFGGIHRGLLLARDEVGDLTVVDIGLGPNRYPLPQLVHSRWAAAQLKPFDANAHKGTRGRVVIVGGSPAMVGAARLAARAAFAAGAGLVHLVAPEESLVAVRVAEPDLQTLAQDFTDLPSAATIALVGKADVVIVGPGLGRGEGRSAFVLAVVAAARRVVIDADALHALRNSREALRELAIEREILCTPHVGEFRTLFPEFSSELEVSPWDGAHEAAAQSGMAVLLKGVPTVVASRDLWLTVAAGNPGLATGGSGDLLSGLCAAFMGQGLAPAVAGAVAAQALGDAADFVSRRVGERAMRPMDVIAAFSELWRDWQEDVKLLPLFPVLWQGGDRSGS